MVGIPRVYPSVIVTRYIHTDTRIISYRLNPSQLVIEGQTDCSHLMSLYSFGCITSRDRERSRMGIRSLMQENGVTDFLHLYKQIKV